VPNGVGVGGIDVGVAVGGIDVGVAVGRIGVGVAVGRTGVGVAVGRTVVSGGWSLPHANKSNKTNATSIICCNNLL